MRVHSLTRGAAAGVLIAGATTLLTVGPAAARTSPPGGTVVFVRNHNVWITRPDGSGARELTRDGTAGYPYEFPSEDRAGHVVAVKLADTATGKRSDVVRTDQAGHVLQRFALPAQGVGVDFAQVSPDGSTVVYATMYQHTDCSFTPCHTIFEHVLGYASATRSAAVPGAGIPSDALWASWVGNSRVVVGTHTDPAVVRYHDTGARAANDWFTDCDSVSNPCSAAPNSDYYNYFPAVSAQGTRLASVLLDVTGASTVPTYLMFRQTASVATGTPPPIPVNECTIAGLDSKGPWPGPDQATIQTPSWSPDGRSLVASFRGADGSWEAFRIHVGADLSACGNYAAEPIARNATEPFWSPAALKRLSTTNLRVSPTTAARGRTITMTAAVRPSTTGSVTFSTGGTVIGRAALKQGAAVLRTARLAAGRHRITAAFSGNATTLPSRSAVIAIRVTKTS